MPITTLPYAKLRKILALAVNNDAIHTSLEALLAGSAVHVSDADLIKLIYDSEIDKELIRILSDSDPDSLDAFDALEYIADFFAYIRANKDRFSGWLKSIGSLAPANPKIPA